VGAADAPARSPVLTRTSAQRAGPPPSARGMSTETSVGTALDWADIAAMLGDYREALSWLVYVEWLQGSLSPELAGLRASWERGRTA
jgi:hypothetical protein